MTFMFELDRDTLGDGKCCDSRFLDVKFTGYAKLCSNPDYMHFRRKNLKLCIFMQFMHFA